MDDKKMISESELKEVSGGEFHVNVAVGYNPDDPDKVIWNDILMNRSQYELYKMNGHRINFRGKMEMSGKEFFHIQKMDD